MRRRYGMVRSSCRRTSHTDPGSRTRWTKESSRDSLRIRVPQVDSPAPIPTDEPPSPDSSDDSSDDSDSDSDSEDEDGEESEDEQDEDEGQDEEDGSGGEDEGNAEGPRPPILTMTHAPAPSELPPPPDSAVDSQISFTTDQPSSVLPTTLVSLPSETSAPSETGTAESIAATSASSTETAVPQADTNLVSDEANAGTSNRAADVGIILGTLGKPPFDDTSTESALLTYCLNSPRRSPCAWRHLPLPLASEAQRAERSQRAFSKSKFIGGQ